MDSRKKIRILHCIETISSGGVERLRLSFASRLNMEKYEFKIICTQVNGPLMDEFNFLGIELIVIGIIKHPFHWKRIRSVLKVIHSYKPHIIHGAVFEGMSMAGIGGLLGRVTIVILEETSDPQTRSKRAIFLQKILSSFADRVIGISPSVVNYLETKVRISKSKTILINNGVSIPAPSSYRDVLEIKSELGIQDNDIVVGAVGRVYDSIKRFSDILLALAEVKEANIKFLLVGSGPDLEELKELSRSLFIEDQFIPVGYQADPNPYYSLMDIFCIPSAHEGFGLVVAEAMLHRLPVVASSVGGLKDIVIHEETGFLVPSKAPTELAEKLKVLIDNPSLRKQFGEAGYHRAMENYTADRYCKEIEGLYLELLKEKGIAT